LRLFPSLALAVLLLLGPVPAHAQLESFVEAVRDLAAAPSQPEAARSAAVRAAAMRMQTALAGWDRNISALESTVARDSKRAPDLRAAQLRVQLGVAYRTRGRLAEALREFDAAIRLRPSGSDVRVLRALTLEAAGRSAEAAPTFQDAWKLDPRNAAKAYYVATRPSVDLADREQARTFLRAYLTVPAAPLFKQTTIEAAAPPFVVLDAIPDSLSRAPIVGDTAATADAYALIAGGKYKEAIDALLRERATPATAAASPRLHFARGQAAESLNRVADARREYQLAAAGALAGRSMIFIALGRLAQVEGDGKSAIDALTRASRLSPNDALVHRELAAALAAEGRSDDALPELVAALLVDPLDGQALASIGQLYLDDGRLADAVAAFTRALGVTPDRFELRYALATAYSRLGDTGNAATQLELYDRARRAALEQRRKDLGQ
jgi:tetratricopeptide (TPR) repeat protein